MPRITDNRLSTIVAAFPPGNVHEANGALHIHLGSGAWGQYSLNPRQSYATQLERARKDGKAEAAKCAAAGYGTSAHGCNYANLKGWVGWAYTPKDPSTKATGGFAIYCAEDQAAVLAEVKAAHEAAQ